MFYGPPGSRPNGINDLKGTKMSKYLMAVMGGLMLAMVAGQGQGTPPMNKGNSAQQKQQERQNACNARANDKGLSGNERKDFVALCLRGDPASAPK